MVARIGASYSSPALCLGVRIIRLLSWSKIFFMASLKDGGILGYGERTFPSAAARIFLLFCVVLLCIVRRFVVSELGQIVSCTV